WKCCQSERDAQATPPTTLRPVEGARPTAGPGPGPKSGGLEFHQCDQAVHLRFLWQQLRKDPSQSHGFLAQLGTQPPLPRGRRITLVEHQVEDFEDVEESGITALSARHLEPDLL